MSVMLNWSQIDSVFLDMDGTLLDLYYDNHFWLSHVPLRYAQQHGMSVEESRSRLAARYQKVAGTMQWYCVDYWTRELGLDIARLKEEISHLIAVHPHVVEFLIAIRAGGRRVLLLTNAHHKSISLKMRCTGLNTRFDALICAHDIGVPKEHPEFWDRLQRLEPFDPARTLLVDDSVPALRSARDYGIVHLLSVRRPDSRKPEQACVEFRSVAGFAEIMPPVDASHGLRS